MRPRGARTPCTRAAGTTAVWAAACAELGRTALTANAQERTAVTGAAAAGCVHAGVNWSGLLHRVQAHSLHPSCTSAAGSWLTPAAVAPAPVAVTSRPGSRTLLPGPATQAAPRWPPRSRGCLPHVRSCKPAGLGDGPAGLGRRPMTTPPRTTHSKWLRNFVYQGPRLSLFAC